MIGIPVRVLVMIGSLLCAPLVSCDVALLFGARLIWLRFLRTVPLGVSTMYEWGAVEWLTVHPGTGFLPVVIHTSELSGISSKGRVRCRLSNCAFCFSFLSLSFSLNSLRNFHCGVREVTVDGTSVRSFLPIKSSAGERLHHGKGVAL